MNDIGSRVHIMGILNVTPDSFYDGGRFFNLEKAVEQAKKMVADGADSIDVGGESSRPGSDPVSEDEELARVLPVVERLAQEIDIPISIDTYKPVVARACLGAGARMLNDITGLRNPDMIAAAVEFDVPVILMHMQGEPKTMQTDPLYHHVINDIADFFRNRIAVAKEAGVSDIILDPGIGFGKTRDHNCIILNRLAEFQSLGYPILIGASRKSFIEALSGAAALDRLPGTIAANCAAVAHGATYLRVHDVAAARQAIAVWHGIADTRF